jgi:hypothetical protein
MPGVSVAASADETAKSTAKAAPVTTFDNGNVTYSPSFVGWADLSRLFCFDAKRH